MLFSILFFLRFERDIPEWVNISVIRFRAVEVAAHGEASVGDRYVGRGYAVDGEVHVLRFEVVAGCQCVNNKHRFWAKTQCNNSRFSQARAGIAANNNFTFQR